MESGIFITFFDKDEPADRELPPVGPLDQVVVRGRQLVAERASVQQAEDLGVSIDRWLEAELELQRATGEEPGGTKRKEMRLVSRDGLYVRFAAFGDPRERDLAPELGPFAVVVVGTRSVEADGNPLAFRAASDLAQWELTSRYGENAAGLRKPDVALRTAAGAYHSDIAPLQALTAPVSARPRTEPPPVAPAPAPVEPAFTSPPVDEPPALTARDLELIERIEREREQETLRARVQEEERRRLGVDESADDEATTWAMRYRPQPSETRPAEVAEEGEALSFGALLWRMRMLIIGALLVGVGLYAFSAVRTGTAPGVSTVQQVEYAGIAQKFGSARWEFVVNGVQRVQEAGSSRARGMYYVVRVGATNKGSEGAALSPSSFTLIDGNGVEYSPLGLGSGAYQDSSSNPGSPYIWPATFPVGRTVTFGVVFDVPPTLGRGNLFGVSEVPRIRVKLD